MNLESQLPASNRSRAITQIHISAHVFALPNNRELEGTETLYWWDTEEYVISLLESKEHSEVEMVAYAIVSLYDKQKLP
jgi:hypothetical protein